MCVTLVLLSLNACSSCTSLFMKWHIWIIEASGKRGEVINTDCVTCALFTTSTVWCLVLVGVDKEYIHLRVWLITVFVFQVQASLLRGHTWHHHLQSHHVRSNKSGQYECRPTEENSSVIIGFFLISTVAISTNQMSVGCAVLGFFQPMKIHYICTTAQVQFHFPPCLIFCCVFTFVKICKQKESKWPSSFFLFVVKVKNCHVTNDFCSFSILFVWHHTCPLLSSTVALRRHLRHRPSGKRSGNGVQPHIPQRQWQEVGNAQVLNRASDRTAHRSTGEEIKNALLYPHHSLSFNRPCALI